MVTNIIADFVTKTSYSELPEDVVIAAKWAILDFLGVTLAGASEPASKIIMEHVKELGNKPEAGVIAGGFKTSASLSALANGTIGHALDYDDAVVDWIIHPTVAILPPILALGERSKISGKEVIEAYVLGFEIAGKVGSVVGNRHYELGWHNTSTLGSLGAAIAASKVLKLNASQTRVALGISASLAGGLRQNFGTMTKPLHAGVAARNGVVAALLASRGFTADENILEAPFGFCNVFGASKDFDLSTITKRLGSPFSIVSHGICFKLYPCCHGTHAAIDAMLHLREENDIHPSVVVEIECRTSSVIPQILFHHRPKRTEEARFSMEYCLARALVDGEMTLSQFKEEKVLASDVQELMKKVNYSHPDGIGKGVDHPQEVIIKLQNGSVYSRKVTIPKGDPRNPLSWEELCAKYRNCASKILPAGKGETVLDLVSNLETVKDVTELMQLVTY